MEMTRERWEATGRYVNEVFGREDACLAGLAERATGAGLPPIGVSAGVGRLLMVLAGLTNGGRGARLALEIGTLGGYSAIWIARGLEADAGRLITLEPETSHAEFAERALRDAGVASRVELRREEGLGALPRLVEEFGEGSFDFVFVDAIKTEYEAYFSWCARLLAPAGVLAADNVLGGGSWWLDAAEDEEGERSRAAIDRFNRMVAGDERFVAACVPIREGVMIARKVGEGV